jgi:transglutaminase-like putative cysteine protease
MRFSASHRATTYLTVLAAHLSLAFSGELHPVVVIAALAALPLSWRWEPPAVRLERYERAWRWISVAVLGLIVADVVLRDTPLILGGVYFVLFLQTNKLFNRRASRDYLQIYVISFLELVAATGFNIDVSYAACFALYVVSVTWTLILFHLRREMEENYLLRHSDDAQSEKVEVERILNSRRIIGPSFLLATSAVTLVVFLGTTLVFFLFPRIGFGLFFQRGRPGVLMTGFDESIELGGFGTLRDNPTVVMRAEVAERAPYTMRWRGIAFDRYDGKTWTKTARKSFELDRKGDDIHWVPGKRAADLSKLLVEDIYLEPIEGTSALFEHGTPVAFEVAVPDLPGARHAVLRMDDAGDVSCSRSGASFRYRAYTEPERPPAAVLRAAGSDYPAAVRRFYLDQKPENLTKDVADQARRWVGAATNPYDMAAAIEWHLRNDFAYTTELRRVDEKLPPLDDFLFNLHAGHCEYFSTAMAVMLRTLGVPTRNVNGFLGGVWNDVGSYYAVRSGDAHSWVEVYFPGSGWVWFDPTPAAVLRAPDAGVLATMAEWVDALRMQWFKYFIEYDLGKQVGAVREIAEWWQRLTGGSTSGGTSRSSSVRWQPWAGGALGALLLLLLALRWPRLRRLWQLRRGVEGTTAATGSRTTRRATRLYLRLVAALAQAGWRKDPRATPREFARELCARDAPEAEQVAALTERYNRARFGGEPLDEAEYAAAREQVRRLERTLRAWRAGPTRPRAAGGAADQVRSGGVDDPPGPGGGGTVASAPRLVIASDSSSSPSSSPPSASDPAP